MKKVTRDVDFEDRALVMLKSKDVEMVELGYTLFRQYLTSLDLYKKMRTERWPGARFNRRARPFHPDTVMEKKLSVIALINEKERRSWKKKE